MDILLAEDDRITRASLRRELERWGHRVIEAEDGARAWDLYQSEPTDMMLTDWEMPRMSGPELARRVRARTGGRYVYIVILTGRSETSDIIAGMEAGADDFLAKPFDKDELKVRLAAGERIIRLERTLADLNANLQAKVDQQSAQLVRSRDAVIFGLAKLADSRDHETGRHIERVCAYAEALAGELHRRGLLPDETTVRTIASTAALHDIGKVAAPDAVLRKPGPLTDEERRIMQRHAADGGEALLAIRDRWGDSPFLTTAAEIALGHHEQWNGGGYPSGLKGDAIPLSARIVALADVYDALTSRRVYKPPMPHDEAAMLLRRGSGTHFDPRVVEAFGSIEEEFKMIAERLA